MRKVLNSTQTVGEAFLVGGGRYQLIVKGWTSEVKLQIGLPETDPLEWLDTDQIFSDNGVKTFWASHEAEYRVVAGMVGASVYLQLVSIRAV